MGRGEREEGRNSRGISERLYINSVQIHSPLPPISPPHLAIGSATLFPSNLAMVSLSGKGSTQHAWMSGGGPVKEHNTTTWRTAGTHA